MRRPSRQLSTRRRRRPDDGAVAVEGALVAGFILVPLLLGVLFYGSYFWNAQRVPTLDTDGIPPESASGTYTCAELTARVKSLLAGNVSSIAQELGVPESAVDVGVGAINRVPTLGIGVNVNVTISVHVGATVSAPFPLPNGGTVDRSYTQQLPNVKLSTVSC